jgi:peptide/nickel transport system permease protein
MFWLIPLIMLTWWRWDLVWSSLLSLIGFTYFSLRLLSPATPYWSTALVEYWVALAGWLGTASAIGLWLLRGDRCSIVRMATSRTRSSRAKKTSMLVLLLLAFVGVCSPFIVPIDPTVQGELTTTRLLRPLACGQVETRYATNDGPIAKDSFESSVQQANSRLLARSFDVRGGRSNESHDSLGRAIGAFRFMLGTDDVGRDVLSRVLSGTRISLLIGGTAAAGAVLLGALVGILAGMSNKWVDSLLMRFTDLFLAVPSIILVIALVAFIGQSVASLVAVLSLTGWMSTARIVRAEVHILREKEYIAAAKLLGTTPVRIMVGHVLPNVWPILATSAVLQFGNAMLGEAALSFLGLGIQAPTASWGNMIGESIGYVSLGWWVGLFPGALLSGAVLATHVLVEE